MKETYYNLTPEKRERIINAVFTEFARNGYEKTSLDAIVKAASISKGGLYEYIESKEDLFEHALEEAYRRLSVRIRSKAGILPEDPLERTVHIARIAVGFYIEEPACIAFIVRSSRLEQAHIQGEAQQVFDSYFQALYDDADYSRVSCGKDRLLLLLKWLLIKTRNDFLDGMAGGKSPEASKATYLEEWDFFLSVLRAGVYGKNP